MNRNISNVLILVIALFGLAFIGCNDDDASDDRTTVYGSITFENEDEWATWQDSGEVQVTIFPEFSLDPLAGWGMIPDNTFGPGVPGGTFAVGAPYNSQNPVVLEYEPGKTVYNYEIEVEPGIYSALAVGFRHDFVNDPALRSATLGVYWDNPDEVSHGITIKIVAGGMIIPVYDFPAPESFEVGAGQQLELNFKADFGFVNTWYQ